MLYCPWRTWRISWAPFQSPLPQVVCGTTRDTIFNLLCKHNSYIFVFFPFVFQGEYTGGFPHLLTSSVTLKSPSSSWLCFSYLLLFLISRGFSDDMVVYLMWRQWSPRPNTGPVWQHLQKQKCQCYCGEGGSTKRSPDVEGTCYQQIPVSYREYGSSHGPHLITKMKVPA